MKSGRINKRKHELYELHINEQEAEIVRLIFDKYVYEGYGAQRIATYLNNAGTAPALESAGIRAACEEWSAI